MVSITFSPASETGGGGDHRLDDVVQKRGLVCA